MTIKYFKTSYEFNRTITVSISGPENRQIAVNVNEPMRITLKEEEYHIIANVHVSAGVNSTDVIGNSKIKLNSNKNISIEASGLFARKLTIR